MKKFIPIVTILGITSFLVCSNNISSENIHNDFYQDVECFAKITQENLSDTIKNTQKNINKYSVKLNIPSDASLVNAESKMEDFNEEEFSFDEKNIDENLSPDKKPDETIEEKDIDNINNDDINTLDEPLIEDQETTEPEIEEDEKLLTIYSLSRDIEETCDKYCELKNLLTETILETQTLIKEIRTNDMDLTSEQRLFLNEQSNELKNLGKELIRNTNELNIYLKDVNGYLTTENNDLDSLCLKYLLLLNNLSEGGDLMNNSLASLTMMNNIMRMSPQILPENNFCRILYGFQRNNEDPIIKQYDIDPEGNIIEKIPQNENLEEVNGKITENEDKKIIDSYDNKKLRTNIDSYRNSYNNIDSFFNTALLDNELMFGGNGMNYSGGFYPMMYGGNYGGYNYPYANFNNQYQYQNGVQNGIYGINNINNTQDNQNKKKTKKKQKNKKLKKNVDTYRDDTTPNPKQRFKNLKAKISNIFDSKNNEKLNNLKK